MKIVLKVLEWRLKKHILPKFSSLKFGNVSNYLYVVIKLHVISLQKIIDQNLEFYPIPSQVPIWQLIYPSEHELQCNLAINDKTNTDNINIYDTRVALHMHLFNTRISYLCAKSLN